jgi:hypothetical protein
MKILKEISNISNLRKNQQLMSFYMLFVATLLFAFTAKTYYDLFGANGLILKDYSISIYSLIIFIPFIGNYVNKNPLFIFKISVVLELTAITLYFLANKKIQPELCLILGTFFLITSNLIMKPLVTRVDSEITGGCPKYSLLKSKLDILYSALGSVVGGTIVLISVPSEYTITVMVIMILISRYYRNKVFTEIYKEQITLNLIEQTN